MKMIICLGTAIALVSGAVAAQQAPPSHMSMEGMMLQSTDSAATKGYKEAMARMMRTMPKFANDADVDFMAQMRGHHQAAIDMAEVALANARDGTVRKLAQEIIEAQKKEIALIDDWMKKRL